MLIRKVSRAIIVFVVILISTIACRNDSNPAKTASLLERSSEMAKLHDGEFSASSVEFLPTKDNSVVGRMSRNGKVQVFTLQRSKKESLLDSPINGKYEVLYLRHAIVLNNLDNGQKYVLIVSKEESTKLLSELPSSYTKDFIMLSGYGLSMNYNTGGRIDDCATAGCTKGTVSCSNTCCSVSCSAGYQACCKTTCSCSLSTA